MVERPYQPLAPAFIRTDLWSRPPAANCATQCIECIAGFFPFELYKPSGLRAKMDY